MIIKPQPVSDVINLDSLSTAVARKLDLALAFLWKAKLATSNIHAGELCLTTDNAVEEKHAKHTTANKPPAGG